jgi:isocitrate dehydrogenase (NAD+)
MFHYKYLKSIPFKKFKKFQSLKEISNYNSFKKKITLIPGDGIGPEITESVIGIFLAADVPIEWERFDTVGTWKEASSSDFQEVISSIARNRICLKSPLYTPSVTGYTSRNVKLRQSLNLFAQIVPIKSVQGLVTRHKNYHIDMVIIRENTEGEYSGFEQEVQPGIVQSLKVITEYASRRIAEYAFQYAEKENRKKVTVIHKANIQKQTDGLFLKISRETSKKYPKIQYNEMIIDNACMQLVMNPNQFDVVLTPNLYGNIVTNVAAGLIGGPGIMGGANVGENIMLFEPGARHTAQDIAGQNRANPTAMILSATMMLKHLELFEHAKKIERAVFTVLSQGKQLTSDLGGTTSTKEFTNAVINLLD